MYTAIELMEVNPNLFYLKVQDYKDGKVIYSEPTATAKEKAERNLKLFQERQEAIYKREKIAQGDWVILKDGTKSRVTVSEWDDSIQVGGHFGSSVFINQSGTGSHSGSCGDSVNKSELVNTGEYEDGRCWIFADNSAGAGRGIYNVLKFKVWKQI